MSSQAALGPRPGVLADTLRVERGTAAWARDVALVLVAAGLTGALAQLSIHLPNTPVPITGQTLGVLVSGCALGSRRGAAAMLTYDLLGFIGLPWFAGGTSGYVGPNAGYLFGFVLAAFLCGRVAEAGADRRVRGALPAMLLGEVAIYAIGVPWLAFDLHLSARAALDGGFNPFVAGDAIKAVIGGALLPGAWRLVDGRR